MVGGRGFTSGAGVRRNLGSWSVYRSECAHRIPLMEAAGCNWEHVVCTRRIHVAGVYRAVAIAKATRIRHGCASPNADIYKLKNGAVPSMTSRSMNVLSVRRAPGK